MVRLNILFRPSISDGLCVGIPVGWMISSNAKEDTINFFLQSIRLQSPDVIPEYFMSDKDRAQMNAVRRQYPTSTLLLCWWHVLHAWHQHFSITVYPSIWSLLKSWVRITDKTNFWECWNQIKVASAPESLLEYLETYWIPDIRLWSAVYRQDRNIFQLCDTNMLVEAWHHLLKGNFMQGKRNRHLDQLIYTLVKVAIPHYIHKHLRQVNGFEGPDLEVKRMIEIETSANLIKPEMIRAADEADIYFVKSGSHPDLEYRVDLDTYDCSCPSFPQVSFCKHICAVQTQYPEKYESVPTSKLAVHSKETVEPEKLNFPTSTPMPAQDTNRTHTESLIRKLVLLSSLMSSSHSPIPYSEELTVLNDCLDQAVEKFSPAPAPILPKAKVVAPNQHSWTETATVMGVNVKGKGKWKIYTDRYAGGEKSGKKARFDAVNPPTMTL